MEVSYGKRSISLPFFYFPNSSPLENVSFSNKKGYNILEDFEKGG
jgi:hypothetical protein